MADCPTCEGSGARVVSFAVCCNSSGFVRGGSCCNQPVEDRRLEPCDDCGGTGQLPARFIAEAEAHIKQEMK